MREFNVIEINKHCLNIIMDVCLTLYCNVVCELLTLRRRHAMKGRTLRGAHRRTGGL